MLDTQQLQGKAKLVLGNHPFQFINDSMLNGLNQTIHLLGFKYAQKNIQNSDFI